MQKSAPAFDYKKEYSQLYKPGKAPALIRVPAINYIAVRGTGDPNSADGEYQKALEILYAVSFTIRMAPKSGTEIEGYFPYVVPPLEGFWTSRTGSVDFNRKEDFAWISCIRLPEFVTPEVFSWAAETAAARKKLDTSRAEFLPVEEGACVQCMHIGPYDDEPATIQKLRQYMEKENLAEDFSSGRMHHEIYLSDPRRTKPERLRTVIRLPVREASEKS